MESRIDVCIFVGYPKEMKGGLLYDPIAKKVFVSTTATFLEQDYMTNYKPRSKLILEELPSDKVTVSPTVYVKEKIVETTVPIQKPRVLRCSGRLRQPIECYEHLIDHNLYVLESGVEDPTTFAEAIKDLLEKVLRPGGIYHDFAGKFVRISLKNYLSGKRVSVNELIIG